MEVPQKKSNFNLINNDQETTLRSKHLFWNFMDAIMKN